jgi:RimJ/RimL family protein N-acetyltransferase
VEIRTDRLTLRRARESDLVEVNAFLSHPGAMQYWSTAPHRDLGETRTWLGGMIAAPAETSDDFLIEFGGRVIGHAGSYLLPDFGFILHPDYWRRGLGYEAASAAIHHIFETRTVAALTADVDPRNAGSIGLLTKLGFQKTGEARHTYCIAGEWVDSLYFSLDRASGLGLDPRRVSDRS